MDETQKLTDVEIVEKVRLDNRDLYAVIIERYKHKLLRYAYQERSDGDQLARRF